MKTNKKAQVTVFIIIGLILLVSASIVVYMTTVKKVDVIEEIVVPPEVQPVYDYVSNCLYQMGSDALIIAGTQGGYTDLSPERVETRDLTLTPSAYVKIDPSNTFKLPLWFYDGEDRTPSLEFIQGEIARHVEQNFNICINGFEAFKPQMEITPLGNPVLSSILTDEEVVVRLEYPIEVRQEGKATEHSKFMARIPVRLKKMWELASAILKKENEVNFFDTLTIDVFAMDSKIPMDGMDFQCSPKIWQLSDVEKQAKKLLQYYVPKVRVKGTNHPPFIAEDDVYEELKMYTMEDINNGNYPKIPTPEDAFEYNKMYIDPQVSGVDDMKASFYYSPSWGLDINALPNDAGLLRSNTAPGQSFLNLMCINSYHFTYDIIYPIQARIQDPEAFGGQGYIFNFGFPVLIDDNKPNRETFGVRLFEDYYTSTGFCEDLGGDSAEIKVIGLDSEGYMMDSGLQGVKISYHCIDKRCELGETGYSASAPGRYSLVTTLPVGCNNPIIYAEKDGYLKASGQLTEKYLEIEMVKLKSLPLKIVKHNYRKETGVQQAQAGLAAGDEAIVYLQFRGQPSKNEQYIIISNNDNETQYLELVDGTASYDIDVMLNSYGKLIGGYRAKNLTISYDEIAGASEIVLHAFEYQPRPTTDQAELEMISYYMGNEYKEQLKPTFR